MSEQPTHVEGECYQGHMTLAPEVVKEVAVLVERHKTYARIYRTRVLDSWHFAADFDMGDDQRDPTVHRYLLINHVGQKTVEVVKL